VWIGQSVSHFCLSPESGAIADMAAPTLRAKSGCEHPQQTVWLFGHLVGKRQQQVRYLEAQRSRRLEIDHQPEFSRLRDRQIGTLFALEDRPALNADLAPRIRFHNSSRLGNQHPSLTSAAPSRRDRSGCRSWPRAAKQSAAPSRHGTDRGCWVGRSGPGSRPCATSTIRRPNVDVGKSESCTLRRRRQCWRRSPGLLQVVGK